MIPHTQMHLHDDDSGTHGDCWPTCVESILDLPLGTLQRWSKKEVWGTFWYRAMAYLFHHHDLCEQRVSVGVLGGRVSASGFHIISGPSPRANGDSAMWHATVGCDGRIVHDPHPSRAGLVSEETWTFLVPVPKSWRNPSVYYVAGLPCPCTPEQRGVVLGKLLVAAPGAQRTGDTVILPNGRSVSVRVLD